MVNGEATLANSMLLAIGIPGFCVPYGDMRITICRRPRGHKLWRSVGDNIADCLHESLKPPSMAPTRTIRDVEESIGEARTFGGITLNVETRMNKKDIPNHRSVLQVDANYWHKYRQ